MLWLLERNADLAQDRANVLSVRTSQINLEPLDETVIRSNVMEPVPS